MDYISSYQIQHSSLFNGMHKLLQTSLICLTLSACKSEVVSPKDIASPTGVPDGSYYSPSTSIERPAFNTKGQRTYTAEDESYHPLKNYRLFPRKTAILMQHFDIENDWCKGHGDNPETMPACDRRDAILDRLMAKGWCWGSPDPMAATAEFYWLKCADAKIR